MSYQRGGGSGHSWGTGGRGGDAREEAGEGVGETQDGREGGIRGRPWRGSLDLRVTGVGDKISREQRVSRYHIGEDLTSISNLSGGHCKAERPAYLGWRLGVTCQPYEVRWG